MTRERIKYILDPTPVDADIIRENDIWDYCAFGAFCCLYWWMIG